MLKYFQKIPGVVRFVGAKDLPEGFVNNYIGFNPFFIGLSDEVRENCNWKILRKENESRLTCSSYMLTNPVFVNLFINEHFDFYLIKEKRLSYIIIS